MVRGFYCSGLSSKSVAGVLFCTDDGKITVEGLQSEPLDISSVTFSPRIGNTSRYVEFPDGGFFETRDNDAIDRIVKAHSSSPFRGVAHRLESSRNIILLSLLVVVVSGWGFIQFGVPYFSREVAFIIPDEYARKFGSEVLQHLDGRLFEESTLSEDKKDLVLQDFASLADFTGSEGLKLVFRSSPTLGANAFALPDGTVILTDEMVELAMSRAELAAVLLHEIGHIENRHGLRIALQGFSLALFVALISGDVSASSSIISGIPAILIQTGYTRDMESEADSYALYFLVEAKIDPANFANIMVRIEASHNDEYKECIETRPESDECLNDFYAWASNNADSEFSQYFSTHPGTIQRVSRFLEYSETDE